MKKKFIAPVLILLTAFIFFAIWYQYKYSMDTAASFEVNKSVENPRLLLATQGSQYKDFITEGVVEALRPSKIFIKVIDVSNLSSTNAAEWDCIVIVHTWEIGTPPKSVSNFIKKTIANDKIITLSTSGDGSYHIEGVDAITSASVLENVDYDVNKLLWKIGKVLGIEGMGKVE